GDDRYRVIWGETDRTTRFDLEAISEHPRVDWTVVREPSLGWRAPLATGRLLRRLGGDVYLSPFYLRPFRAPMAGVLALHGAVHLARGEGAPAGLRWRFSLALWFTRGAAAVISSSGFSRRELIERGGLRASRLHVVPLGLPPVRPDAAVRPAAA